MGLARLILDQSRPTRVKAKKAHGAKKPTWPKVPKALCA